MSLKEKEGIVREISPIGGLSRNRVGGERKAPFLSLDSGS